ncbi:uncharacterized protein LOC143922819 isoform X3 [Arctopsyche grandis]|uniref:uncharacterized protein LOC143922819 isoform X3 n=1 Tax=Arctopsyche grandis TaxID=121162 RepID=UPI00406D9549
MSELTPDSNRFNPVETTSGHNDVLAAMRYMITPPLPPGSPPPNAQFHNSTRLPTFKPLPKNARESSTICKNFKKSNCLREDCKYSHIIFCLDYVNRGSCNFLKCRFIHCSKEEETHYKNSGIPPICMNAQCQVLGCQLRHINNTNFTETSLINQSIMTYSPVTEPAPLSDIPSAMDPEFLEKIQMRPPPTAGSLSKTHYNQTTTSQRRGKGGLSIDSSHTEYCKAKNDDISYEELPVKRAKYVTDADNCSNCERSGQTYINVLERLGDAIEMKNMLEKEKVELEFELDSNLSRIMKIMKERACVNIDPIPTTNRSNATLGMMIDDEQPGLNRSIIVHYSNQPSMSSNFPLNNTSKSLVNIENRRYNNVNFPSVQHFVNQQELPIVIAPKQNFSTFIGQQMSVQTPYNTQICG